MKNGFRTWRKGFTFFVCGLLSSVLFPCTALAVEKAFQNSFGMEFVLIPAGTFVMGSPPDEPYRSNAEVQHPVTISSPFYMQTTEVTLKQWRAVMGKRFFFRRKGTPDMPVVKVSWYDCIDFIKKLNAREKGTYRLPTEAEWEYACRAGSSTAYSWGNTIECTKAMYGNKTRRSEDCIEYMKFGGFATDKPAPVKSYPPNAWGLYDMHGNVWEWCRDWIGDYRVDDGKDPRGPHSGSEKIRRGGSWFGQGDLCRSANRNASHPASKYRTTGFRLLGSETTLPLEKEEETERIEREDVPYERGP
jgi:formylglycine-generating enzyme